MAYVLNHTALVVLFLSYLSSLNAFRLDMAKHFRHFSFFLLFTISGEFFAYIWPNWLYKFTAYGQSNQWFYNLFHIPMYLFLFYFFYNILYIPKLRRSIPLLGGLYMVFAVINLLFIQGVLILNTYSELFAGSAMIFFSLSYYYQLLNTKEVVPLKSDPGFWISTGVFISHLGSLLALSLINIMLRRSPETAETFMILVITAGILAYLTFSIAFLCYRKKR